MTNLTNTIKEETFLDYIKGENTQTYSTGFNNKLIEIFEKIIPITKFNIGYHTKLEWLTSGLNKSIICKNKLYYKYKKYPTAENLDNYKKN